jgi:hypothetical protein
MHCPFRPLTVSFQFAEAGSPSFRKSLTKIKSL